MVRRHRDDSVKISAVDRNAMHRAVKEHVQVEHGIFFDKRIG